MSLAPAWLIPAELSGGNEARLLRGGDALFPRMLAAVDAAQREVWVATYIFHHDETGLRLCARLVAAARRGVKVCVVVDGFGSKDSLGALHREFEGSGVAFAVFRPLDRWWRWLQPGQLRRLHQKLCVVDGEQGFVGGINLIDDRIDLHHGASDAPRLDFAVELRGPVVQAVGQAARAVWTRAWLGRDVGEELLALARGPARLVRAASLWRRVHMPRGQSRLSHPLPPVRAAFVLRDNLRQRRTIERAYVDAISRAQSTVDLVCPYFYPGQRIRRALRQAAQRGVRVRLLLQGKVDYRLAALAAQALYAELLEHGVEIYEYQPAFLHAKVAVVDDQWATVGSSNIDPLSLLLNLEANVVLLDGRFAEQLRAEIESAQAEARQVTTPPHTGWRALLGRAWVAWIAHVYLRVAGAAGRY
ncbi:cardiolipin synthase ClsB [Roseateles paludis]|uniref:Cardiolipin synthase B n=1 Tax=Roseateles paludis TaxID=3145238 RepID=A0ABV0G6Z8_9BURK